ncbi:MAG: UPF0280 family protein [Proteobacteria bacterium]|nr:UPF0280 family protein [Pseudomonadota bacterium]
MYIEVGPAGIDISAERNEKQYEIEKERLEVFVRNILVDIRECLPVLKQKAYKIKNVLHLPEIARKMVEAVKMVDEATLTPMAAVAGAVSDAMKEYLKREDLDFITVNNGGDISVFNLSGKPLRIGIGDIRTGSVTPYIVKIEGLKDYGFATSGYGGRSFTLGLADICTVLAENGAIADAAATFICNQTNVESGQIVRRKACEIDPLTDIPDEFVTVSIGNLDKGLIAKALHNGITVAEKLKKDNVIYDVIILLKGDIVTTMCGDKNISLEVNHGH